MHDHHDQIVHISSKFFVLNDQQMLIKGVTYGSFAPNEEGDEYFDKALIDQDFARMKEAGFNLVRIPHTTPPRHLLDLAQKHQQQVMVALGIEQYVGYLIDRHKRFNVKQVIRQKIRRVAKHPAIFAYALGNEIQPAVIRWLGPNKIERFLKQIAREVRKQDPTALVTYVNFPSSEYLRLPFLDFVSFNVYLEDRKSYAAYLARLQILAGDRPLFLTEIGSDSLRNGESVQSDQLNWLVEESIAAGCAGVSIFSWTDDWYANGPITDWAFGITDRNRLPKKAYFQLVQQFENSPFDPSDESWPSFSVVICSYNGSQTIRQSLVALENLKYPNFQVIVVDDGSTDQTAQIASQFSVQLISTPNQGLSAARNLGCERSKGEIVAYLDDDAYPPPYWLHFLAITFREKEFAAVGGPNFAPLGKKLISDAIAYAPGGPRAVLLSDRQAEHIPGCNLSIRRQVLMDIGGFDPRFRTAGDDVDVCWRIMERGEKIGYHGAAYVWHYARQETRAFWRQQSGYGKAEALLRQKWPDKYNLYGHLSWQGSIYGISGFKPLLSKWRVYHGVWGNAPFQSMDWQPASRLQNWAMMPEWYLVIVSFIVLTCLGLVWWPFLLFAFPCLFAIAVMLTHIATMIRDTSFKRSPFAKSHPIRFYLALFACYLVQPLARIYGRCRYQLSPWWKKKYHFYWPIPFKVGVWSPTWLPLEARLQNLQTELAKQHFFERRGNAYDRWDLEVRGGFCGKARILVAIENYGGQQMLRARAWPRLRSVPKLLIAGATVLSLASWYFTMTPILAMWLTVIGLCLATSLIDCSVAVGVCRRAIKETLK